MNNSFLTASGNSHELPIVEYNSDASNSLFDKLKCNFSTSSEISIIDHEPLIRDSNEIVTIESSTTNLNLSHEDPKDFNPWLLLFIQSDEEQKPVRLSMT